MGRDKQHVLIRYAYPVDSPPPNAQMEPLTHDYLNRSDSLFQQHDCTSGCWVCDKRRHVNKPYSIHLSDKLSYSCFAFKHNVFRIVRNE